MNKFTSHHYTDTEMVSYSQQQTGLNPLPLTTALKWILKVAMA